MIRRVTVCGKVKDLRSGAEAKASLNRANKLHNVSPKPWRAMHEQDEAYVRVGGGPNRLALKNYRMTCV